MKLVHYHIECLKLVCSNTLRRVGEEEHQAQTGSDVHLLTEPRTVLAISASYAVNIVVTWLRGEATKTPGAW